MGDWWTGLDTSLQFFYAIGFISGFLLIMQLVFLLLGASDFEIGDVDTDVDAELVSVKSVVAFMFGFGWTGVAMLEGDFSLPAAVLAGVVVGFTFLLFVYLAVRSLKKLSGGGVRSYEGALGTRGRVYMRVPAERAAPGQIEITIQGRVEIVDAYFAGDRVLNPNELVTVVGFVDNHSLVVEPVSPSDPASS
jgi:hypothetical protein